MKRPYKLTDVGLGLGSLALALLLCVVALMVYNKAFTDTVDVKLEAGAVGNALQEGSDVKVHGVPVGRVSSVEATDSGATLTLSLDPDTAKTLSSDTLARLLPKTLFGERYVVLMPAAGAPGDGLSNGDVIEQDKSQEAVELEKLFDKLLPLLQTLQPDKLSASLGELSAMLAGQGEAIGDSMTQWGAYLEKLNPLVPQMTQDFARLATVADGYNDAFPDLLDALNTMTVTSKTLVDQQTQLSDVYTNVITAANASNGFLDQNKDTIEILSDKSRAALGAVRPYASQFPCMFRAVRNFIPTMDKVLGKGTDEPGLHVRLNIEPSRGKYLAGKDAPTFSTGGKARCPYITGDTTRPRASGEPDAISAPPGIAPAQLSVSPSARGLGEANSPAENQLIAELMAPTQGLAPEDYPDWASLLLGPALRNTKVVLQ
ncbi:MULTISPECIES: MCE family protein [unclassified Nocardioides]|uniref:MCE family protein n=1 Tax=unclassified Nocardioides TaxID=2615069 RepID=UPI0006FA1233|nr:MULTISPECIES: MCE family protein [unclassified Nocardioides]KQY56674.1 hypothetical protein ASD30_10175 [Nocardioides sp. Root140]KQZ75434.1 hypothetical protein ASD66_03490 [Nocardioides sp. Root151]